MFGVNAVLEKVGGRRALEQVMRMVFCVGEGGCLEAGEGRTSTYRKIKTSCVKSVATPEAPMTTARLKQPRS